MQADRALILGASSPAGSHLAAALNRRSIRQRAIMRSAKNEDRSFVAVPGEPPSADATDAEALTRALQGYQLIYDCRIASGEDAAQYPAMARNLAIAAARVGAKIVHVSNYWSFLPLSYLPLDEDHPRERGADWVQRRREAEDALLAARAAVIHLPDFYGPLVHRGAVQRAIEGAHSGRAMPWAGSPSVEREYAFASDAMEAVVRLSYCPEALGQRWIVGGNGAISANRIAEIAGAKLNKKVRVAAVGPLGLRLRALFDERTRDLLRMPDNSEPIRFNNRRLRALIGPVPVSSHEQGIARTLEWLQRRRLVK